MPELDDIELLRQYQEDHSETAFTALVERYLNLVYSTALRRAGSPPAAEEITQAVFILLAKKAGELRRGTVLSGWLYHTTQLTAANFLRGEIRRQRREQEAHMQSVLNEPPPTDEAWRQIGPLLEDAMAGLSTRDRDALVLRFFENKNLREIGAAIGTSEDAAKVRVNRALEKLRKMFTRRGVNSTTNIIAGAITVHSVHAAPATLVKTISTVAIAKGAAAGTSTLALVKGVLKVMAWTKAQTIAVAGVGILLATGTTVVIAKKIVAPSATLAWADDPRSWEINSRILDQLPAGAFIFRPTRFPQSGGAVYANGRMLVRNYALGDLVNTAYGSGYTRTVLPAGLPHDHFDVVATVLNGEQRLQKELKERFHLTAHRETREMDVLLLKVKNPNPPNLKPHTGNDNNSSWIGGDHKATIVNQSPNGFFSDIEGHVGQPVLDQTGLTGRYDIQLDWKPHHSESEKDAYKRAILEQLGLALVPSRESIEVLVVEKLN
jgi:uncharacterized protein (TIGR03435 family)